MRKPFPGLAIVLALPIALAIPTIAQQATPAEKLEPALELELDVGGKSKLKVELDKPFHLDESAQGAALTLRAAPTRGFNNAGVAFRYPREYSFSFEQKNAGTPKWNLAKGNTEVVVHRFAGRAGAATQKAFAGALMKTAGATCKQSDATLTRTNASTMEGTRVEATFPSGGITRWEVYTWVNGQGTMLLLLKGEVDSAGKASPDYTALLKSMTETLTYEDE